MRSRNTPSRFQGVSARILHRRHLKKGGPIDIAQLGDVRVGAASRVNERLISGWIAIRQGRYPPTFEMRE